MINKYTELLAQKQIKAQSDLILMAMPDKATMQAIRAVQHGHNGKTVYEHDGKPFLEVYPPEFETVIDDGNYKIKATQNYRVIK